jgi:hypothetical protein
MGPSLRGPAPFGWQGSTNSQLRGNRFAPTVDKTDPFGNEVDKGQISHANLLLLPRTPSEKAASYLANRRLAIVTDNRSISSLVCRFKLWLRPNRSIHSYVLPTAGSGRVGFTRIKNNFSTPCSLFTSCTDSSFPSSALRPYPLISPPDSPNADSSMQNQVSRPASFQIVPLRKVRCFAENPVVSIMEETVGYQCPFPDRDSLSPSSLAKLV